MNSAAHLAWPFFDEQHRTFKSNLQKWTRQQFAGLQGHDESREAIDRECVSLVKALGQGSWLKPAIAGMAPNKAVEINKVFKRINTLLFVGTVTQCKIFL